MNSRLGWRWTLFRAAAKPLVACALSLTLVPTVLSPQAVSAQQLPGPAQPGIPLVTPPVIPQPSVPPTVVPETEPLAPPPGAENIRFKLDNVKLQGVTVYTPDQLKPLYAGLLGKEVPLTEIFKVADAITAKYRTDGYILSRAVVPAQKVENGTVTIQVLEGYVDKVTVQGKAPHIVTDYVNRIRGARPLTAKALERYLLLANDIPGVTARAVLLPSKTTPDAADLLVNVETKPVSGFGTVDNRGSRYVGPVQYQAGAGVNSPLGLGEQLQARIITTTPTDELRYGELSLTVPVGPEGTTVSVTGSKSRSEPGFKLSDLDVQNDTNTLALAVNHPIVRSRAVTLRVGGRFEYNNLDSDILDTRLSRDRLRVVRVNGALDWVDGLAGVNRLGAEVSQGLNILDETETGSDDLSRANGHSDFTKITFSASRLQRLAANLNLLVAAAGQYAFNPLLSSEEFGLGGPEFLRAFDPSEQVGDDGLAGRIELQYLFGINRRYLQAIQIYGFGDAGEIWNEDAEAGEEDSKALASAGAGLRFNFTDWLSGGIEVAVPLNGRVAAEDLNDPGSGDDLRVFGNLAATF
jgi:hemolysin activation/secretion protein